MTAVSRVALVTGASRGIGRATALALSDNGFLVALAARDESALLQVEAEVQTRGGAALHFECDVSREDHVLHLFQEIKRNCGRLDLLFNNAGTTAGSLPIEELSFRDWSLVVSTNLTGTFLCTREAFLLMKIQRPQGGRIINNGSVAAHTPRPNSAAYTATKHGITGLTKSTSLEGRKYSIACGQIDIGNAATRATARSFSQREQPDGSVLDEPIMSIDDVAQAVVHMSSLPLTANVQFMTIMATAMPYIGRG